MTFMSGYQDSNLGPPVPKTGALPGCATPRLLRVLFAKNQSGYLIFFVAAQRYNHILFFQLFNKK
jgi:hypothetical protein